MWCFCSSFHYSVNVGREGKKYFYQQIHNTGGLVVFVMVMFWCLPGCFDGVRVVFGQKTKRGVWGKHKMWPPLFFFFCNTTNVEESTESWKTKNASRSHHVTKNETSHDNNTNEISFWFCYYGESRPFETPAEKQYSTTSTSTLPLCHSSRSSVS